KYDTGHFEREKRLVTPEPLFLGQRFQKKGFSIANRLDAFEGKITGKSREHEARPVYRWLANDPFEAAGPSQQAQLQAARMFCVEPFDGNDIALHKRFTG